LAATLLAAIAYADNILVNDIAVDTGSGTRTLSVTTGAVTVSSASFYYRVQATGVGSDGQAGCNAADGSPVTISLNGLPAGVTVVSDSGLTFSTCGNTEADRRHLHLDVGPATVAGSYPITVAYSDSGVGAYGVTDASFTLEIVDGTPPNIAANVVGTLGNNGWYTSNVGLSWTVADLNSGIDSSSGCGSVSITADQASTDYTCEATNGAGLFNSKTVSIKRDATAPTIVPTVSPAPNGAGWHKEQPVIVSYVCNDNLSGLDPAYGNNVPSDGCWADDTATSEGLTSFNRSVKDLAGNSASVSPAVRIDLLSDPVVAITSPVDGFVTSAASVNVSGTATDSPSGIAGVTVNGNAASYDASADAFSYSGLALACGANLVTAVATDVAGRTDSDSITVTRSCVTFTGFYSPVDPSNVAKAGQGVSLKWNAYNGSVALANELTSTAGFMLSSAKVPCDLLGAGDAVPAADDAGTSGLRYDYFATPTANAQGQFVFVWKTLKDWANSCRVFKVTNGGAELTAMFRFTR
jgi:Tfp pilus assembly protein PilX